MGRLYEQYHSKSYDPAKVSAEVKRLYADPYVKNRRGVFEYILGGLQDSKLLDVRVFDDATKKSVYAEQTRLPKLRASQIVRSARSGPTPTRAEYIISTKWTQTTFQHGARAAEVRQKNCQMLCITHNRAKGNR